MRALALATLVAGICLPSLALAHHISGTLYCDVNWNGVIDGPDTALGGYTAQAVSQTVSPGQTFSDVSDGTGFYYIGLQARTDDYLVSLSNLPGGQSVVVPASGSYLIHIVTGNSQLDHAENVNFLVQGCAPAPTTTTTTSTSTTSTTTTTAPPTTTTTTSSTTTTTAPPPPTTTTSTSSTTSTTAAPPTTSTTSTTTSTTTPTTVPTACGCAPPNVAFLARRFMKVNNDGLVAANIGVNDTRGFLRLSRSLQMPDGTLAQADRVELGDGASIWAVNANDFKKAIGAEVRSGATPGTPALPLTSPFCPITSFDSSCNGPDVLVQIGETRALAPGVYGRLRMIDGGTLQLGAGTYTFCDAKTGQGAVIETQGAAGTTILIGQRLQLGDGSVLGPQSVTDPIPVIHLEGKKFRLGEGAEATMYLSAPNTKLTMGRDSKIHGTLCVDFMKTDKHTTLDCPCGQ